MANLFKKDYSNYVRACSGYFTQPLISLILLFIFRPYDRGHLYMAIWQFFLIIVFLTAIFNCDHSKKIKIVSASFSAPAFVIQWVNLAYDSPTLAMIFLFFTVIFVFITAASPHA